MLIKFKKILKAAIKSIIVAFLFVMVIGVSAIVIGKEEIAMVSYALQVVSSKVENVKKEKGISIKNKLAEKKAEIERIWAEEAKYAMEDEMKEFLIRLGSMFLTWLEEECEEEDAS